MNINININELNTLQYCHAAQKAWCGTSDEITLGKLGKMYVIAVSSIVVSLVEVVARTIFTVCYLPFAIYDAVTADQDGNEFFIENLTNLGYATLWAVASPILAPMSPLILLGFVLCCPDDDNSQRVHS